MVKKSASASSSITDQRVVASAAAATAERNGSDSSSKYKGVRKRKWGKWVSEVRLPNSRERIWLGSYDTPEKAARAFDAAQFCLRGETANFNFPDNPPDIPGGRSLTPSEIQAAASRFANSGQDGSGSRHSDNNSSSYSSEAQPESPFSDGAPQVESENILDTSFIDHFSTMGSDSSHAHSTSVPDYGIFPGFDDFSNDFYMAPPPLINNDYDEDNYDAGFTQQTSYLWNF